MDAQLEDLRQKQIEEQKQRVIPKPKIDNAQLSNEVKKPVSSENSVLFENHDVNNDEPIIMGGEDRNSADARKKRDKVKAVSENSIPQCDRCPLFWPF